MVVQDTTPPIIALTILIIKELRPPLIITTRAEVLQLSQGIKIDLEVEAIAVIPEVRLVHRHLLQERLQVQRRPLHHLAMVLTRRRGTRIEEGEVAHPAQDLRAIKEIILLIHHPLTGVRLQTLLLPLQIIAATVHHHQDRLHPVQVLLAHPVLVDQVEELVIKTDREEEVDKYLLQS